MFWDTFLPWLHLEIKWMEPPRLDLGLFPTVSRSNLCKMSTFHSVARDSLEGYTIKPACSRMSVNLSCPTLHASQSPLNVTYDPIPTVPLNKASEGTTPEHELFTSNGSATFSTSQRLETSCVVFP